jgi:hypothetical protein
VERVTPNRLNSTLTGTSGIITPAVDFAWLPQNERSRMAVLDDFISMLAHAFPQVFTQVVMSVLKRPHAG